MEQPKRKVIATCTPEEIAEFRRLMDMEEIGNQTANDAMRSVMSALKEMRGELHRAAKEFWIRVNAAHGIDAKDKNIAVDVETGEVFEVPEQPNPLAMLVKTAAAERGEHGLN